ncbi:hypothetical protein CJ030_MR3G008360 [Morella rubra]|uniref:Fe2OG dioxygenase domain-containing protein n=1 Tax=Morella rubra TaxID=262757 RepID=A0A6A1W2Q8_9ROSI|nr:hypothetical protein CJ030_MR3G008371 [Morella rubra]KAB1219173.1 hypothetical protein CJ030_MR3G008360 [Morella rubra]
MAAEVRDYLGHTIIGLVYSPFSGHSHCYELVYSSAFCHLLLAYTSTIAKVAFYGLPHKGRKMVVTNKDEVPAALKPEYDRASELKAFDETKAGVKGLVDAGVTEIPHLEGVDKDVMKRKEVVERVRDASETWGFFQVVNHWIPVSVLEEMKEGVRRFHEQDREVKKELYTRDFTRPVVYISNSDLYSAPAAKWIDTLFCVMAPYPPNSEDLPAVCRDILEEHSKQVMNLGIILFRLLSDALGLNPNHLNDIDCTEGLAMLCHYYPPCPQPELTLGTAKHADNDFVTVLLQDHIGGLQILQKDEWLDIPPVPGALLVNIGDLLQASFLPYSCVFSEYKGTAVRD